MPSKRAARAPARGRLWRALTAGDRPFVVILAALVAVAVGMALGPLQMFTAAADRVDELERERDRLQEDVDGLEERRQRLEDPEEVERLARSELGLVRPGEIPFVVVVPESEGPEAEAADDGEPRELPWYRRLGRWVTDLLSSGEPDG